MENGTPQREGRNPILPHQTTYVNSENLNSYTKPPFLGFLQTTKPSKPPYKNMGFLDQTTHKFI